MLASIEREIDMNAPLKGFLRSVTDAPLLLNATGEIADAIGCQEWTDRKCNRKGECFCRTGAARVLALTDEARLQP